VHLVEQKKSHPVSWRGANCFYRAMFTPFLEGRHPGVIIVRVLTYS
jgi:hypothetical protein